MRSVFILLVALTDAFLEDVRAKGTYLRNQIEALDLPIFEERAEGASIQYLARRDLSGEWLLGDSGQYR